MLRCGLLGKKLGHSYSPAIHGMLGNYAYELYERAPEDLAEFLKTGDFHGLNVTIPYKKSVVPLCAELSDFARRIGSVNTLVRRRDGSLYGDNTDGFGFEHLVRSSGISVSGKKTLVLGSGGASVTVCAVLKVLGAGSVTVISRTGEDNYKNLSQHADAQIVVNTTPVGMYPGNGETPVDLALFPDCEGVLDIVYNPARTALLLQAEILHIPHAGGLRMLAAQAKRSAELFTGKEIDGSAIDCIVSALSRSMENIVLVGMPGCGKSTLANLLAQALQRPVYDSDALIEQTAGISIPEIFAQSGEETFRNLETQALAELGKGSGTVISTGGGSVLREENYPLLHQNGKIFWICRDIDLLAKEGRPISMSRDLQDLYNQRFPHYQRFADHIIDNNGSVEKAVQQILEVLK